LLKLAERISIVFPVPDDDVPERRQKFIVGLRFRAIASFIFTLVFIYLTYATSDPGPRLSVILALLLLLGSANLAYWLVGSVRGFPLRDFYAHWVVDLVVISHVLYWLGGINVPYGFLSYLMIVVTSATLLSHRAAWTVAAGSAITTLTMAGLQANHLIQPPQVWAVQMNPTTQLVSVSAAVVFYFIFAYLAGTLADQLKHANVSLLRARGQIELQNALLEEKVAERTRQLEKRKAEIEEFVHIVTHDLKNVSVGATETARRLLDTERDTLSNRATRYVEHLLEDTRRMNEMLRHVLAMFRIDYQFSKSRRVDLEDLAKAVLRSESSRLEAKGIRTTVETLPEVVLDESQLKHVLTNLIDNAIKYVGEKPNPEIRIDCQSDPAEWVISVRDNGIGVSKGQVERIFHLYHRGPEQLVAGISHEGQGVGLAISKRIVERWGGRIWVEAEPSGGSCFSFSVPRVSA